MNWSMLTVPAGKLSRFVFDHQAAFPLGYYSYATGPIFVAYGFAGRLR